VIAGTIVNLAALTAWAAEAADRHQRSRHRKGHRATALLPRTAGAADPVNKPD
jgi:hypothetical protein